MGTVRGTCSSFVEHDRIARHREYDDQFELFAQLGVHLSSD
ncbi:hypothetical protein ACFYOK_02605 [Microbispora bryophytorum]